MPGRQSFPSSWSGYRRVVAAHFDHLSRLNDLRWNLIVLTSSMLGRRRSASPRLRSRSWEDTTRPTQIGLPSFRFQKATPTRHRWVECAADRSLQQRCDAPSSRRCDPLLSNQPRSPVMSAHWLWSAFLQFHHSLRRLSRSSLTSFAEISAMGEKGEREKGGRRAGMEWGEGGPAGPDRGSALLVFAGPVDRGVAWAPHLIASPRRPSTS